MPQHQITYLLQPSPLVDPVTIHLSDMRHPYVHLLPMGVEMNPGLGPEQSHLAYQPPHPHHELAIRYFEGDLLSTVQALLRYLYLFGNLLHP
jgi:hypothetical protein